MTGNKRIVIICFCIFLGFMAVCTVIAKGLYTSGLPRVIADNPQTRNISHDIKATGMVKQGQEFGVYTEAGLRVAAIPVHTGDNVEAGAPLFQIDTQDLEKIIREKELSLAKLNAQLKEAAATKGQTDQTNQLSEFRAREDYTKAVRDAELDLSRKREALKDAEKALEEYQKYLSDTQGQVSGGDSDTLQSRNETLKSYKKAVEDASWAVEDAILAREDSIQSANRTIEDTGLAKDAYSSAEAANRLDAEDQRELIRHLKALQEAEGWVYAPETGKITAQKLLVGERTPDTACILYALDEGQRILEVALTEEQAKYAQLGDAVLVSYNDTTGKKMEVQGVITYLSESQNDFTVIQIPLEGQEVTIGQTASISLTKQSEPYELCIPISALYTELTNGNYIYQVEEQQGILGTEWRIHKMPVTVLDKNESYAAIESGGVTLESRIVMSVNKEFSEGDVIRLIE